ncbi:MAG TPA: NlpC/P60 family protein [Abditibacteriaceae bacterium]|jgi:cell wall-associated NlpC family hydrolase
MKLFSLRLSGASLTLGVFANALSPVQAAPADSPLQAVTNKEASLPWLGSTQDDEFSRAANALEVAREAEKVAARRAARGEITTKEWQAVRDTLQRATRRVEELLARQKAMGNSPKATSLVFSIEGASQGTSQDASKTQMPFLVSMPPQISKKTTDGLLSTTSTSNTLKPKTAPVSSLNLKAAPRVTVLNQRSEGSITAPAYANRQMLHAPQKAGERRLFAFVPTLPQKNKAPLINQPVTSPVVSTPAVTKITKPEPKIVTPQAKTEAKNSGFSSAELQRLAQLDAELRRADNRLNAANRALSDGQDQLNRFAGTLRQAMLEAGPDAVGLHPFVKVAEKYAGTPYVWGGESRRGFDCSGMIIRVMRDLGYKALPHSAAEQFKYGKPIAQPLLKPGDLVFFANTYKAGISHVGIYLGKRRFIHAAGTGKGTIVSSLDQAKFQSKYAGARRLIAARN